MTVYRLHHNGAVINYFESLKACAGAIKEVIDQHRDLEPQLIMNYQQKVSVRLCPEQTININSFLSSGYILKTLC